MNDQDKGKSSKDRANGGKVRTARAKAPGAVASSGGDRQVSKPGAVPEVVNSVTSDSTVRGTNNDNGTVEFASNQNNVSTGKVRTARASVPGAVTASGYAEAGLPEVVSHVPSGSGNNERDLERNPNRANGGKVRTARATAPGAIASSGRDRQVSKPGAVPEVFNSVSGDSTVGGTNIEVVSHADASRPQAQMSTFSTPEVVGPSDMNTSVDANPPTSRETYLERINRKQGGLMNKISEEIDSNSRHKQTLADDDVVKTAPEGSPSPSDQNFIDAVLIDPEKQDPPPATEQDTPPPKNISKRTYFLLGSGILIIIGIIITVIIVTKSSSSESCDSKPTETKDLPPPIKDKKSCYNSLKKINEQERNLEDYSTLREYHLCPNTTYTIAEYDKKKIFLKGENQGKDHPLMFIYSNVHVKCGSDGSSSNNCILRGGSYQAEFFSADTGIAPKPDSIENVIMQGLTFEKAKDQNIIYNKETSPPSHLTVKDCVFEDNDQVCIEISRESSSLVVEDSTFHLQALSAEQGFSAVIHSEVGPEVTIHNSKFIRNYLAETVTSSVIFITSNAHKDEIRTSKLNITQSCFSDNKMDTAIAITDDETPISENNFADGKNVFFLNPKNSESCLGIGNYELNGIEYESNDCIKKFDAPSCAAT